MVRLNSKSVLSTVRKKKLTLEERRYTCGCGYSEEREESGRILQEGIKILAGRRNTRHAEAETAGLVV
jgi:hypothetical protein